MGRNKTQYTIQNGYEEMERCNWSRFYWSNIQTRVGYISAVNERKVKKFYKGYTQTRKNRNPTTR
jgi:phosphatidylinositol kinase/protein kinase (PI-3  family)